MSLFRKCSSCDRSLPLTMFIPLRDYDAKRGVRTKRCRKCRESGNAYRRNLYEQDEKKRLQRNRERGINT